MAHLHHSGAGRARQRDLEARAHLGNRWRLDLADRQLRPQARSDLLGHRGNPAPQIDAEYRPGDNSYASSLLALDTETGAIKWHFQFTPNDPYDYDEIGETQLIDTGDRNLAFRAARTASAIRSIARTANCSTPRSMSTT